MLIVLLPEIQHEEGQTPQSLHWWRLERDGQLLEQGQSELSDLHGRFASERVRALAPSTAVSLYRLTMPVRRAAAIRAALPFALEDQLSQDLEVVHCVGGPRRDDDRIVAAVVEHSSMLAWQGMFADLGWRLEAILPLAVLHTQDAPVEGLRILPSVWPDAEGQALVVAADQEPVFVDEALLGLWLRRRLADMPEAERQVQVSDYDLKALGLSDSEYVSVGQPGSSVAEALRVALQPVAPLNLLTGPYAVSMAAPPWRKARSAMIAAAVLLGVLLTQFSIEWWLLAREQDRLQAGISSVFQSALPNSRMTPFPAEQFRQVMQGNAGANGADSSGQLLYEVLAAVKASKGASIKQFRATLGELEIELQMPSFAELESLRSELASKPGLSENLQGADSGAEGVTARLRITRGES
ncbi:MAG: type II secretion system protein GspL [Pseudomonas sp.]